MHTLPILPALYNEDNCRMIRFGQYERGKSLDGHVIAKIKVLDEDICQLKCYHNDDCVSYNFGPSETGDDICELNNSTDRRHLKIKEYFVFQGTEVRYICYCSSEGSVSREILVGFYFCMFNDRAAGEVRRGA